MSETTSMSVPPDAALPVQEADQPLTPKKLKERWERAMRATRFVREQAAINEQFILNRQWLRWNRGIGRLEELPRSPDRVRATINRVGPDSHRLLSKLTSRELTWDVRPSAPDDQAIQASRTAEQALFDTARNQHWEDLRYEHALACWQGGVAGMMVEWDDSVGTPIAMGDNGRMIHTGDVRITVVPVHEIAVEPGTRNAENALWWIHGRALPPAEVREAFGLAKEPKADARATDSIWRVNRTGEEANVPLTMVYTFYERPCNYKEGQILTMIADEFVDESPWYFPWMDRLNLSMCKVQPITNKWWGHTPVSDAIAPQVGINAAWSSILEHLKLAGNARLWIPEGSVDDLDDLSDTAGEFAQYNPINGQRPQYESPPSMPEWWIRAPDMLGQAMDDTIGQHDISRGVAPSGVESGLAMSLLSENDDTPVGRFGKNIAGMWGRVGSNVLELYARFVGDTRVANVVMPNTNVPETVRWNGAILQGHTTATVPMDAVTPRNRNAQAAYAFQLHDRGLIQSPIELARIADLPDQDDLLEGIDPDSARAMRENSHMAAGQPRTVDTIDDHQNHMIHHRNFMRSQRFENLPVQVQTMIRMHMAAHELYAAQQAAQVTQAASVSPLAAALPTESISPLDPAQVAQAAMFSQFAPSAATGAAPGMMPDMGMVEQQLAAGPPSGAGGLPQNGPLPGPPANPQEAVQPLLEEQPPQ